MRGFNKLQQEYMDRDMASGVGSRVLRLVEDVPTEGAPEIKQPADAPHPPVAPDGVVRKFIIGPDSINGGISTVELGS